MPTDPIYSNSLDINNIDTEIMINFKLNDGNKASEVARIVLNQGTARQLLNKLQAVLPGKLAEAPKQNKLKVLVVEDNTTYRNEIVEKLKTMNYDVHSTINGDLAIKVTNEIYPDIIIMDHIMPVLNGLDAARIIKQIPAFKSTRIFLLIGYGKITDFEDAMGNVIYKLIQKPLDFNELQKELAKES